MKSSKGKKPTPSGGPATIGGVVYQMLWCLLRLTRYEVRRVEADAESIGTAVLVLEPTGGGGDAREVADNKYTVTQIKARSGGGTWSLQEIIKEVLPDLLKAAKPDERNAVYQFVSDGRCGDWEPVARFFRSLRDREPGSDPASQLDNTVLLKVGSRQSSVKGTVGFWEKPRYTERELFEKIVDELWKGSQDTPKSEFARTVWHLLANFEFGAPLSWQEAENEIDLALAQIVERVEDVSEKRRALLMQLAEQARIGNARIELGTFLKENGLKAIPADHVPRLQARSREVVLQRIRDCKFDPSQHVQDDFTATLATAVREAPVVALIGPSGSGKSWHSYALAEYLSRHQTLVAHVKAAHDARTTLNSALGMLWNTVKGQDATMPYERIAERLPGPPPTRVVIVDRVEDAVVARDLACAGLESLGIRLVMAVGVHAAESLRSYGTDIRHVIEVPAFSPSELSDYLVARRVAGGESIPSDVRDLLAQPMLARIYCDLATDRGWMPTNEYELFEEYWKRRVTGLHAGGRTFDLSLLRELARVLLNGSAYPWKAGLVSEKAKDSDSLSRLQKSGWFTVLQNGDCCLWHDRLLNWLIADTLVYDLQAGLKTVDQLSEVVDRSFRGELRPGGRWMGYVAMDVLWLLTGSRENAVNTATVLRAMEKSGHSRDLYTDLILTLGERAVAPLLVRLDQTLTEDSSYCASDIASCLARLPSPEAVAKAGKLLMSDSVTHQSVALEILHKHGDPASLDRLWSLHVQVAATPDRYHGYDRRFDALKVAIAQHPDWLIQRLYAAHEETPCLADLVFLLARLKDGGAAWRSLKAHLKTVVPADKRRCLLQCINMIGDNSELEFVHGELGRDADMAGDMALAVLTRLAPEIAIEALAHSSLQGLYLSRGWHLHRLLAARPEQTQAAVRAIVARAAGAAIDLYSGAENEIDEAGFAQVLMWLSVGLDHALSEQPIDENGGIIHHPLTFLSKVHRADLLDLWRSQLGTKIETNLAQFLESIGPRSHVGSRLCDKLAFAALELLESPRLEQIVAAGLDAESWFGRIDAAEQAHKHANTAVLHKLRSLAGEQDGDRDQKFVAYVATHALCFLEDWEGLCDVVVRHGLSVSPHLFEQRRGRPALEGPYVDEIRRKITDGERTSGVLLAAGLVGDQSLRPLLARTLSSGELSRDQALSAAIALDTLGSKDSSVVAALAGRLSDETLRERFFEFLLAIDTPESLSVVERELTLRFNSEVCSLLGRHDGWAVRAAEIAWKNKEAAERSISFGLVLPLLGHIKSPEIARYLERLAYGLDRIPFDRWSRAQAIKGLALQDAKRAFAAAEHALRDEQSSERWRVPQILMGLDQARAIPVLFEFVRTLDNEVVELAIAEAIAVDGVMPQIEAMFTSADPNARRIACILASRQDDPCAFRKEIRERALDVDERVAATAIGTLRDQLRVEGVQDLIQRALQAKTKSQRWILLDRAAEHAKGSKEAPPVARSVFAPLDGSLTHMEAERFNRKLKKGREDYERGVRDRAERRSRSS